MLVASLLVAFCGTLAASTANGYKLERIVNGIDSDIEKFPYLVSLRKPDNFHTCGGNLISPYWVLTSSMCILRPGMDPPGPIPGTHTIQHSSSTISPTASVNVSEIVETIVHPHFYPYPNNSYIHDVTLLRLAEPVYVSRYAMLPTQFADIAHGTPTILPGWSRNETDGPVPDRLREVELIIYSDEECRNIHHEIIHPSHICAGVPEGGRGGCSGISGSPLLVNGVVVGLGSWNVRPQNCGGIHPTVFTQVSYYREYIRQITGV